MTETGSAAQHVVESVLDLGEGRTLRVYDAGEPPDRGLDPLTVVWHHGTPNIGAPPRPSSTTSGWLPLL